MRRRRRKRSFILSFDNIFPTACLLWNLPIYKFIQRNKVVLYNLEEKLSSECPISFTEIQGIDDADFDKFIQEFVAF